MLEPAAGRLPPARVGSGRMLGVLPGCTVGSRQAEHESHRESMEEDDMVMRVGNSLGMEETNRWGRKGCKPKGL